MRVPRGHLRALGALSLALSGCLGTLGDVSNDDSAGGPGADVPVGDSPRVARLTQAQWENTIQDLFHLPEPTGLASQFQPDPPLGRFDNNIDRLAVTPAHWRDYQRAAEQVAGRVSGDAALLAGIMPTEVTSDPATTGRAFASEFGQRAFRRPLTNAEVDRYTALFVLGPTHYADQDPMAAGARLVIEAMLQSPWFLYRTETSTAATGDDVRLSGWEMASRLSYGLWNTMPDQGLFAAASAGDLDTLDGVRAQAERLFEDARTRAQFTHLNDQVFGLPEYAGVEKDPAFFPDWSPAIAEAMEEEASRFLEAVVFDGGAVGDFLTSTRAFVNGALAAYYGVDLPAGADFTAVDLDATQRAGFLTRVGFLARWGTLRDPDPIHRGVFANRKLLCREINAVPNLPDDLMPVGDTNRERIESINGVGTCGENCHATIINPLGFALENYDAVGRWRTEDNGFPVNAADTYLFADGRELSFMNGIDLSRALAEASEVHACYVSELLEYFYGRTLGEADGPFIDELSAASLDEDLTVRELILRIVTSKPFRYRTAR